MLDFNLLGPNYFSNEVAQSSVTMAEQREQERLRGTAKLNDLAAATTARSTDNLILGGSNVNHARDSRPANARLPSAEWQSERVRWSSHGSQGGHGHGGGQGCWRRQHTRPYEHLERRDFSGGDTREPWYGHRAGYGNNRREREFDSYRNHDRGYHPK